MIKTTVSKKEILASKESKKNIKNLILFLFIYLALLLGSIAIMLYSNPTQGAILLAITSIIFWCVILRTLIVFLRLIAIGTTLPCYKIKIQDVRMYLMDRVPVFYVHIKDGDFDGEVETNAIYHKKDIFKVLDKTWKVVFDQKKNRIYIITLEN